MRSGNQDADRATAWDQQGHEFLGAFSKYGKANIKLRHVCPFVLPSAWDKLAPTGRIFLKFDILIFENLSREIQGSLK